MVYQVLSFEVAAYWRWESELVREQYCGVLFLVIKIRRRQATELWLHCVMVCWSYVWWREKLMSLLLNDGLLTVKFLNGDTELLVLKEPHIFYIMKDWPYLWSMLHHQTTKWTWKCNVHTANNFLHSRAGVDISFEVLKLDRHEPSWLATL